MKALKKLLVALIIPTMAFAVTAVTIAASKPSQTAVLGKTPDHTHEGMTAWDSDNSLPSSAGRYYLTKDVTISSYWYVSSSVDLCLNGHSITKVGSGYDNHVIETSGSNTILNLYDCGEDTHYYYTDPDNYHMAVVVDSLEAAQAGNPDRYGSFAGGYITGGRGKHKDDHSRAGCVYVDNHSQFNFYGGTLIGNCSEPTDSGGSYGVIWAHFADVTMHDRAAMIGNYSPNVSCVGINKDEYGYGSFSMDGGLVVDNTTKSGGAIANGTNTSVSILGGLIKRNYNMNTGAGGGAIISTTLPNDQGVCTLAIGGNVEITENWTDGFGGGLLAYTSPQYWWGREQGVLSISGSPKIYGNYARHGDINNELVPDNVYLWSTESTYAASGQQFTLAGPLEEGANVGVTIDTGSGVIFHNWADTMGDADPADYLFSDDDNSILVVNANGDPCLINLDNVEAVVTDGDATYYYDAFADALPAWGDGMTLKLTKDVVGQIEISSGNKTLDLNDHALSYEENGTAINVTGGGLHIIDSGADTIRYYEPSNNGAATLSATETEHSFKGGYIGGSKGRAIVISGGEVTLSGGTLFANDYNNGDSGREGAGVYIGADGHFILEDGGAIIGNYAGRSTGVAVYGTFDMTGGLIRHNSALFHTGGLCAWGTSSFNMTGGEISGNHGNSYPGVGVYADSNSHVSLGGKIKILDNYVGNNQKNLAIFSQNPLTLSEPLAEGTSIGIYPGSDINEKSKTATEDNPIVLVDNWAELMGEADPNDYFVCDPLYDRNGTTLLASYEIYAKNGQAVASSIDFVVQFNGNSGTGSMEDVHVATRNYTLPENGFDAPEGMRFLGWLCSKDGKLYSPGTKLTLGGDTVFTAQWVAESGDDWVILSGIIYQEDGTTPASGATVKLMKGDSIIDFSTADSSGKYRFTCPDGIYNIVSEYKGFSNTILADVSGITVQDIVLNSGKTESFLTSDAGLEVAVGGLDREAEDIRASESVSDEKYVAVTMNVEQKTAETAQNADKITDASPEKVFEFYEINVQKTIDDVTTEMAETSNVIEICIPYKNINKKNVTVYSYHEGEVRTFQKSDTKADGTFMLDETNGVVKIYTSKFSTFAIGYSAFFDVNAYVQLGSYTGNVNATLKNVATGETFTLENVALDQVIFTDVPKGNYTLTITWVDGGVTNTLSIPVAL